MGNKVKPVTRTKKRSYKSNAEHMNDIKRRKKVGNINTEVMSNAPRPIDNGHEEITNSYENYDVTHHNLKTVVTQKNNDCEVIDESTCSSKHILEEAFSTQVASAPVSQYDVLQPENQETNGLNYSIEMENYTSEKNIQIGRRIIDISHFFKKLQEISGHGPLDCGLSCIELVGEKLHGLSSKFTFLCKMCKRQFVIDNDGDNCLPINTCAVAGAISIGCGHSQLQEFSSAMNLPIMSQKTYQKNHKLLSENWQQLAQQSMDQAAEEERSMAIAEGSATKNGTSRVT